MVVWSSMEASCPVCSNRVRLREVGSGFATGQDSDLLVRMTGKHIIQAEIHTCARCRYSGYSSDFLRSLSEATRKRLLDDVLPTLIDAPFARKEGTARPDRDPTSTPLPDVQYYWAAKAAGALLLSPTEIGERLLRAYWCLRLPPSKSLPAPSIKARRKLYLKAAIQRLRQGLRDAPDRNLVYLAAELCRRNGNFSLAVTYFGRFREREPGAKYLKQAAAKLGTLARDRISAEITMEEILYDRAPEGKDGPRPMSSGE